MFFFHLSVYPLKAKQSLATLTKDVPKRHSLAMPTETVVNGNNQEWVMHADLPLTAAIRQSQQSLYVHTGHATDRQGRNNMSTCTVTPAWSLEKILSLTSKLCCQLRFRGSWLFPGLSLTNNFLMSPQKCVHWGGPSVWVGKQHNRPLSVSHVEPKVNVDLFKCMSTNKTSNLLA